MMLTRGKNPKPADGIHDVDKIRQMRNNITRRQPRASLRGKGDDGNSDRGTPMSGTPNGQFNRRMTVDSQDTAGAAAGAGLHGRDTSMHSPVNARDPVWMLNKTSWQVCYILFFSSL